MTVTLLLQGVEKIKNGQDLASVGDQAPRTNATLLLPEGEHINKFKWL